MLVDEAEYSFNAYVAFAPFGNDYSLLLFFQQIKSVREGAIVAGQVAKCVRSFKEAEQRLALATTMYHLMLMLMLSLMLPTTVVTMYPQMLMVRLLLVLSFMLLTTMYQQIIMTRTCRKQDN